MVLSPIWIHIWEDRERKIGQKKSMRSTCFLFIFLGTKVERFWRECHFQNEPFSHPSFSSVYSYSTLSAWLLHGSPTSLHFLISISGPVWTEETYVILRLENKSCTLYFCFYFLYTISFKLVDFVRKIHDKVSWINSFILIFSIRFFLHLVQLYIGNSVWVYLFIFEK